MHPLTVDELRVRKGYRQKDRTGQSFYLEEDDFVDIISGQYSIHMFCQPRKFVWDEQFGNFFFWERMR